MTKPVTLALQLQVRDGVLMPAAPSGIARFEADVAEALVERVAVLPSSAPVHLRIHLRPPEGAREQVAVVIRQHYAMLREQAENRLRRTTRAGRLSLVIGGVVLLAALTLAEVARRLASGGVGVVLEEGLTIVGWVALWRPLDLLLFERWALRRQIALYRRMERMEIVVEAPAKDGGI